MARLPQPGSDAGTWGDILNTFLSVAHNADGTLRGNAVQQAGAVTQVADADFVNAGLVKQTELNVMDFGAAGDGRRVFGAVASATSPNVNCANAAFTSADAGKLAIVYNDTGAGTITTIQQVTDGTHIVLAAAAGVTTSASTGYLIYGTDDATSLQDTLNAAGQLIGIANTGNPNQPIGSGHITVRMSGKAPNCLFLTSKQLLIPSGVEFYGTATLANVLTSRNTFCVSAQPYSIIRRLEIENLFGTGISCGAATSSQSHIVIDQLLIWHSAGSSLSPVNLQVTAAQSGGSLSASTRYYAVTAIDSTGGETKVSNEVSATTTTGSGANTLTWDAFSGAVSYRIYRGFSAGTESAYFTTSNTTFVDTGGAPTFAYPIPPGTGLRLLGYDHKINSLTIKEATIGVYHWSGSDCAVNYAYVIGCATGVRCNSSNQVRYSSLLLDTCGGSGSWGGVMLDNGCSNVSFESIQAFTINGANKTLSPVVNIGNMNTANKNTDIRLKVQANNTGGIGLAIANAQDVAIDQLLSNDTFASGTNNPITTAVAYGSNLSAEISIRSILSASITNITTGTRVGTHNYQQGGQWMWSAGAVFGSSVTVPAPVNDTDASTKAYADTKLAIVKTGIAKLNAGTQQWGIPGTLLTSASTDALTANTIYYTPLFIPYKVTLTNLKLEVTTGPTSAGNLRVGVYAIDTNMQPSGAPLLDSGDIAITSGFTGTKTLSGLSAVLNSGAYVVAVNCDLAMTIRALSAPTPIVADAFGASPFVQRMSVGQAYGAFSSTPPAWTSLIVTAGGVHHLCAWRWTE